MERPYGILDGDHGEKTEEGINGGIMRRNNNDTAINTVDVKSLDASIKTVEKVGGKIVMPKSPIPGYGWFARCTDTEGNIFGLMQRDTKAK